MRYISLYIILFVLIIGTTGCGQESLSEERPFERQEEVAYIVDEADYVKGHELIGAIPIAELSVKEQMGLTQMREEEKLARDVYTTLGEKWDMNVFKNIAKSEQTHTDTIKVLIERYGIDDPVTDDTVGVFSLPAMQSAYNEFVATGNKSLVDALIVGAMIEDLDIQDLENFKRDVDNEDILIAYENLQKGSRNHLRAFIKNLERQGGGYEAKYMSAEMFTEIIEGAQERGPASK